MHSNTHSIQRQQYISDLNELRFFSQRSLGVILLRLPRSFCLDSPIDAHDVARTYELRAGARVRVLVDDRVVLLGPIFLFFFHSYVQFNWIEAHNLQLGAAV